MTPMQQVKGIYLPASDTHFPDMIRKGPSYAGHGTYQMSKIDMALAAAGAKRRGIALDIGAHVGLWSLILATQFEIVHAFEMCPTHFECLKLNTLPFTNVMLHAVALGGGNGDVKVHVEVANSGNTRVASCPTSLGPVVKMLPLDSYFPDEIVDFIKIDVEGYEEKVVIGGVQLIKRSKPVMVIEQKPGHAERYGSKTGEVLDLLKSWGARILWSRSGDHCLSWG